PMMRMVVLQDMSISLLVVIRESHRQQMPLFLLSYAKNRPAVCSVTGACMEEKYWSKCKNKDKKVV
ncbi:MAG: hypothetical protein WCR47_05995, partial [Desulfoplanes sp.]